MRLPKQLEALGELPIWMCYLYVPIKDKDGRVLRYNKPPINPRTLREGSSTDSRRWTTFEEAASKVGRIGSVDVPAAGGRIEAEIAGVGITFEGSDLFGIDLDHVIRDGKVLPEALEIVKAIGSYTEISPSGDGLHIICRGQIPKRPDGATAGAWNKRKNPDGSIYEVYDSGRYFTVTGNVFQDAGPVAERSQEVAAVHRRYFQRATAPETASQAAGDYAAIWARMFKSAHGDAIRALYDGDLSAYNGDHSSADFALMNHIGFAVGYDPAKMEAMFSESALADRDKWRRRADYRKKTIENVIRTSEAKRREEAAIDFDDDPEEIAEEDVAPARKKKKAERPTFTSYNVQDYLEEESFDRELEYFTKYKDRKTGFVNLDKYLTLYPGLACLGGSSSVGKTSFCVQLADQLLARGETVLYFALEQAPVELVTKSIARRAFMTNRQSTETNTTIKDGARTPAIMKARQEYRATAGKFEIVRCDFTVTAESIREYVSEYVKIWGSRPVVFIDYLQLISPPEKFHGTTKEITDHVVKVFKTMQVENELLVILISNFNRSSYMTTIRQDSFKESGLIEYTCDYLWGLQLSILEDQRFYSKSGARGGEKEKRLDEKAEAVYMASIAIPREVEFISLKSRNGRKDYKCFFRYYPQHDYFEPDFSSNYDREWTAFNDFDDDDLETY